jgi:mRNA-degrading endonuclease RelE of RelBE toxin-antitoxin system
MTPVAASTVRSPSCSEIPSGDVVVLKDYPVAYRRRVGPYRILFDVDPATRSVQAQEIDRRASTTYRKRR